MKFLYYNEIDFYYILSILNNPFDDVVYNGWLIVSGIVEQYLVQMYFCVGTLIHLNTCFYFYFVLNGYNWNLNLCEKAYFNKIDFEQFW